MKSLLIFVLLFLMASPAHSEENVILPHTLPLGQTITHKNIEYKAFTLEEYKQIGLIYADYLLLIRNNISMQKELTLHLDIEKNYELQVEGLKGLNKTLELDRAYWTARVKEEQEANKRRETFSGLERFGAWALVVIEAVALCSLGISQAAKN